MAPGKNTFAHWHIRGRKSSLLILMSLAVLILFLTAEVPCFAVEEQNRKVAFEDETVPLEKIEVLTADSRDKAESLAKTLEESGYRPIVVTEDLGGKPVYKVFILLPKGEQIPARDKERYYESEKKPSWDILGRQNRIVHGSLTLSGIYTDNVLNSNHNRISDFSTVLSPALWLVLPHTSENIAPAALDVRSPGGSQLSRQWPESLFHYQASLYYRTDIPLTSSSGHLGYGTTPAQTLAGKLLLIGNRLSLLAEDHYEYSYHNQEAGAIIRQGERDRYNSNYFGVTLSYDTRHRFVLSGGYSNFITSYQSDLSDFMNRRDNGLFGLLTYKLSPRLSLLAEYRFFDISYDHTGILDSREHYFLGGISWDITAKSKGLFKAGYVAKDFDQSIGSSNDFSLELQLEHHFTPKTSVVAGVYRKPTETDLNGMAFSLTNGLDVRLLHILTPKLTAAAGFLVEDDHYRQLHGLTGAADSTTYQVNAELQYAFRRWLRGTVGYAYTIKNASVPELEYNSNTLFFNVIASF
jgi:polysaccharide biosynthesis protein VpsM